MLDSGSEETLLSREVTNFLDLSGVDTNVTVVTADGRHSPLNTVKVNINVGPLNRANRFTISDALVMENLPSIGPNFPSAENLSGHDHLLDLIEHFPVLLDKRLHMIIGAKETFISHYSRVRQAPPGKPWAAKTKLGWVVYGPDKSLDKNETSGINFVRTTNEMLDRKLDTTFEESRHDDEVSMSFNDKRALSVYEQSVTRMGKHYAVALPFKDGGCEKVPDNLSSVKKQFSSLSRRLSKSPEQLSAYAKFMNDLFSSGHAVVLEDDS